MKISLIPWEIIWLIVLLAVLLLGLWALLRRWLQGRISLRLKAILAGLGLTLILIPLALRLFGYQFRLDTSNTTITAPDHAKPQLRTHIYLQPPGQVYDTALEAVKGIRTWGFPWTITYLDRDETGGVIKADVHLFFLTDDIFLFVRRFPDGTHVNIHSQSRLAVGDLGENDRHAVQFFRALEATLGPPAGP